MKLNTKLRGRGDIGAVGWNEDGLRSALLARAARIILFTVAMALKIAILGATFSWTRSASRGAPALLFRARTGHGPAASGER